MNCGANTSFSLLVGTGMPCLLEVSTQLLSPNPVGRIPRVPRRSFVHAPACPASPSVRPVVAVRGPQRKCLFRHHERARSTAALPSLWYYPQTDS